MTINKNQRNRSLLCILIILIYIVGAVCFINYQHDNNTNAIIGTWTSENMFKEDFAHIQLVCFENQTGYIIKNNITIPIKWECELLLGHYVFTPKNESNFPIVIERRRSNDYFYLYCFEYKTKLYQQTT